MARSSLFVRPLEQGEMEFLVHLRKSRRQAHGRRAQILLASMVYTPVYQIALICQTDEAHVRRVRSSKPLARNWDTRRAWFLGADETCATRRGSRVPCHVQS
jgi:hypothetical protein